MVAAVVQVADKLLQPVVVVVVVAAEQVQAHHLLQAHQPWVVVHLWPVLR